MKNKFLSVTLFSLVVSFSPILFSSQPEKCPEVSSIAAIGIEHIAKGLCDGWDGLVFANNYGTPNTWTFGLMGHNLCGVPAKDESEAREKMQTILKSLKLFDGPRQGNQNQWFCSYTTDDLQYMGIAINPPVQRPKR